MYKSRKIPKSQILNLQNKIFVRFKVFLGFFFNVWIVRLALFCDNIDLSTYQIIIKAIRRQKNLEKAVKHSLRMAQLAKIFLTVLFVVKTLSSGKFYLTIHAYHDVKSNSQCFLSVYNMLYCDLSGALT